jgi:hypothetical protein
MAESCEVFLGMDLMTSHAEADNVPAFMPMYVRIKGTLRRRAFDAWFPYNNGLRKLCDLGTVGGMPLFMMFSHASTVAQKKAFITFDSAEVSGSSIVVKDTGVIDLDSFSSGNILGPELAMTAGGFGMWDAVVLSSPWLAHDATLHADGGPWRVILLEFEEGTVEVDVQRS